MSYNAQEIFSRLGLFVKWHNQLGADADGLDAIHQAAIERFDDTARDRAGLVRIGAEIEDQKARARAVQAGVSQLVEQYVTGDLKASLNAPYDTVDEVLADLIEAMNEASPPDRIDANAVAATTPEQDPDNHRADGTASSVAVTEMARDENYFEVVCADDSPVGRERWSVHSSVTGDAPTDLVTGEPFAWADAGIASLTIDPLPVVETGDALGQLANWSLDGLVRGGNADEEGRLFVQVEQTPAALAECGDQHQQTANWSIFGASLENTGRGKLYVALAREPSDYLASGDEDVDLADWSLSGLARGLNTDPDGKLYVSVTRPGSAYVVSIFKDPQRRSKVAEGSTSALFPAAVGLYPQNGSGVSGSVRLDGYTEDDEDIVLESPCHFVRLYSDPSRAFGLVAEGVSFAADAAGVALEERDGSGLWGAVDLDFGIDNADIELSVPLRFVRLYRRDPAGLTTDEKEAQLVAQGAVEADAGSSSSGSSSGPAQTVPLTAVHGSGVTGQVDFEYLGDAAGIQLQAGWRRGDKWTFTTTSDEEGAFQRFFRDRFGLTLPSAGIGAATIADALAE